MSKGLVYVKATPENRGGFSVFRFNKWDYSDSIIGQ
jgi:hypothetical protein